MGWKCHLDEVRLGLMWAQVLIDSLQGALQPMRLTGYPPKKHGDLGCGVVLDLWLARTPGALLLLAQGCFGILA